MAGYILSLPWRYIVSSWSLRGSRKSIILCAGSNARSHQSASSHICHARISASLLLIIAYQGNSVASVSRIDKSISALKYYYKKYKYVLSLLLLVYASLRREFATHSGIRRARLVRDYAQSI